MKHKVIHLSVRNFSIDAVYLDGQLILGSEVETGASEYLAGTLSSVLDATLVGLTVDEPIGEWNWQSLILKKSTQELLNQQSAINPDVPD